MWLLKTEPGDYSYADLESAGSARWDGVRNPFARRNLRQMKVGDLAFIYHTGKEKAVIGVAEVIREAYRDPAGGPGALAVDLKPRRRLARAVTLAEIKALAAFGESPLVRQGRLSVVPLDERQWREVERLGGGS